MKKILGVVALLSFSLVSCAHHRDVRPGADGVNRVVVRSQDKDQAERSAISQAEDFCKQSKTFPAFVNEETKYTGSMDEKTRDSVKKASTAAMILGGTGVGVGRGATRAGGGVLGTAGVIGGVMTGGKDYTAEMRFICK